MDSWPPKYIEKTPENIIFGSLSKYLLSIVYVFIIVISYILVVHFFQPTNKKPPGIKTHHQDNKLSGTKDPKSGGFFTVFILIHNLVLASYSLYTFINSFKLLNTTFHNEGVLSMYCDTNYTSWNNGMFELVYWFYLSKYYELIDTAIILIKRKRSSLLQTYHHSGAIISMYFGIRLCPSTIFYFVVVNSFIHSIMYCYYTLTTLGFTPPGKKYITSMQITQFIIGIVYATYYVFSPVCGNKYQRYATMINIIYVLPLIYLFVDFALKTYGPKKAKQN
ncbi:hypothetical protein BB559_000729 [Furculomyces boomerangus]|uniref:Elongation of fatty acids protein n=2 Tax=Harpellales TaxID=61421 RepID=A0A2T9Z483_9FUNG|nr:hypothetical protein BB559_000729 [Furculomyces boomerangus]PWA01153.1 hypothetical protein BB558_002759 [Smittium angustum]